MTLWAEESSIHRSFRSLANQKVVHPFYFGGDNVFIVCFFCFFGSCTSLFLTLELCTYNLLINEHKSNQI